MSKLTLKLWALHEGPLPQFSNFLTPLYCAVTVWLT